VFGIILYNSQNCVVSEIVHISAKVNGVFGWL